ncbi:uncharacterized protein LOC141691264 [Apium graveolens]|uniref:uncharacterized protein LOC141691264 n=1 Tax=Apium graveolens TaxID=4045 RepID=UPI003D7A7986
MAISNSGVLKSIGRNRKAIDSIFRVGSLELVDKLKKRHVDVVCVQETKFRGAKTKEANEFKLWYSGVITTRNSVGIMLRAQLNNNVVEVNRFNDRVMMIKLVADVVFVNIVSAYAPHVGLGDEEEKKNTSGIL